MNWALSKKTQLHTRPAPSSGLCTIAEEADLDYAYLKLQKLEETNRIVRKECKQLKECFLNLARCEQKLTADLAACNQVHEDDSLRQLAEQYLTVAKQAGDIAKQFSDTLQITVNDPLKKLANEFGSAQTAIKKRDQMIVDLLPVRKSIEKLKEREKTGTNVARLEQLKRSLSTMESDFRIANKQLLADQNEMLNLRAIYMEPSLYAFIRAETHYYWECTKLFNSLIETSPQINTLIGANKSEPPAVHLTAQFNSDMQAIRSLSIVSTK